MPLKAFSNDGFNYYIMVNYGLLSPAERVAMFFITIVTNSIGIPTICFMLQRREEWFEAVIYLMSLVSSLMYHLCEVLNTDLFLTEEMWHKFDNIFVISSLHLMCLYFSGVLSLCHKNI